jgi:hypothetical protein
MSAFNPALWWLKWASHAQYWVVADRSSGACSPKKGLKRLAASARGAMAGRMIDQVVAVSDFVAHRNIEQNMLPRNRVTTIYTVVSRIFCTNVSPSQKNVYGKSDSLYIHGFDKFAIEERPTKDHRIVS